MTGERGTAYGSASPVVVRTIDVALRDLPPALTGLRIAHVSDFHFGRWNRVTACAQEILLSLDYDLLAATGDFGTRLRRWRRCADIAQRFFEPLARRRPIFAVLGNHDDPRMATAGIPVRFLCNEAVPIDHNGARVVIAGVDQTLLGTEDIGAALSEQRPGDVRILLAHYPSTAYRLPAGRVDLQLSGHTHGGQIRVPFFGCLWTHDAIPTRMARGLHLIGGTQVHVSPGIGVSPPIPVRLNCPAEIAVLTLVPVESAREDRCPETAAIPALATGGERV